MPLPILKTSPPADRENLPRLFHQAMRQWSEHLGEPAALAIGSAVSNAAYPDAPLANALFEAMLPTDQPPEAFMWILQSHEANMAAVQMIALNPSADTESARHLAEMLTAANYQASTLDVLSTRNFASGKFAPPDGIKIIPARAAYAQLPELLGEFSNAPDLEMLHYDDSRYDALIALQQRRAVAHIGLFTVGQIGLIQHLFVTPTSRRQGIARTLLHRALEIAHRSLLSHLLIGIDRRNTAGVALTRSASFEKTGEFHVFHRGLLPPEFTAEKSAPAPAV